MNRRTEKDREIFWLSIDSSKHSCDVFRHLRGMVDEVVNAVFYGTLLEPPMPCRTKYLPDA